MNQRAAYTRHVEMGFGRRGGFWAGVLAVLSSIAVIVLAILFSALFLGLFVAIAVGVLIRAWLLGRKMDKVRRDEVIDAEYTVIDSDDAAARRRHP